MYQTPRSMLRVHSAVLNNPSKRGRRLLKTTHKRGKSFCINIGDSALSKSGSGSKLELPALRAYHFATDSDPDIDSEHGNDMTGFTLNYSRTNNHASGVVPRSG